MKEKLNYINLGCGFKVHESWINADMVPALPGVIKCNFLNGIPFEDNRFEVVYHSHVLEHFSKSDGAFFLKECYRILQPNGIIRIALPNLEKIATEYLNNLQRASDGEQLADADYDWILLEMYDQTVRNYPGGEMGRFLEKENIPNFKYVNKRIGLIDYQKAVDNFHKNEMESEKPSFSDKVKNKLQQLKWRILFRLMNEDERISMQIGRFRRSGEIHQWMYDRYSLQRLLTEIGFRNVTVCTAKDSYINNWEAFGLDNPNETASLFMEGIKVK